MKIHPLPFASCVLLGALALSSCTPIQTENTATPEKNVVDGNSVIPNAANSVDQETANAANADQNNAAVANAVESGAPAPTSPAQLSVMSSVLVPGQDDLLHEQKVSRMTMDSQLKSGGDAAPALQEIIEKAPAHYPPGAKINSAKDNGKAIVVDLNSAFDKSEFWSQKGEKTTELAIYALINSAARKNQPKGAAKPVKLTIEKKPVLALGEYDFEGEITPQARLVAK